MAGFSVTKINEVIRERNLYKAALNRIVESLGGIADNDLSKAEQRIKYLAIYALKGGKQ